MIGGSTMKTLKSIIIAATLICASFVSTLSAQNAQAEPYQFRVAIGDSVMIKRECQKYSTGERPSTWVWDKVHTVRQLGTKRHPDGVLLMNIYSWICDTCLINVNGRAAESAEEAVVKQAEEREAFERGEEPTTVQQQKEAEEAAKRAAEEAAAIAAADSASRAAEEARKAEEAAAIAAADSAFRAAEEARKAEEEAAVQRAKEDSIKSVQHFKHNYDRFTIGLRGGASALMHHAEQGKWNCGGDVVLDLQYAHYWADDSRKVDLGIIAGLGIGYHQSSLKAEDHVVDTTIAKVDYTVSYAGIKETDHQLQLEVPLMFSLIHDNGLFFNIGPKFMIPVYTPYKQTVDQDNTQIAAYFEETGITVIDKPVTGVYDGQQPEEKNGIQFNINIMLTAEIGYEWILKSGNSLGLGAYANYSVYNSYKNTANPTGLFNWTAPTDDSKANLTVLSATHAYADKLGYFDAGIKLAYHFNFPKKRHFKDSKLF